MMLTKKFAKSAPTLIKELRPFAENLAAITSNAELLAAAAGIQKCGCGELGLSLAVSLLNEKVKKAWMCSQTLLALVKDALASAEIEIKVTDEEGRHNDRDLLLLHSYFSGLTFSLKHVENSLRRFVVFHEEAKAEYAAAHMKCEELLEEDSNTKGGVPTKRSLHLLGGVCGALAGMLVFGNVAGVMIGAGLGAVSASELAHKTSPPEEEEEVAITESQASEIDMATVAQVEESMIKMKEVFESTDKALEEFTKCVTTFGQIFDFFLDDTKPLEADIDPTNSCVSPSNKKRKERACNEPFGDSNHLSQSSECFEDGSSKRAKYDHEIEVMSSNQTNHSHTDPQCVMTIDGDSSLTAQMGDCDIESQFPALFDEFLSEAKKAHEILISCEKNSKLHKK